MPKPLGRGAAGVPQALAWAVFSSCDFLSRQQLSVRAQASKTRLLGTGVTQLGEALVEKGGLFVGVSALALALAGGKDGPVLFDLGGVACYCQALVFWCPSDVAPGLPQK